MFSQKLHILEDNIQNIKSENLKVTDSEKNQLQGNALKANNIKIDNYNNLKNTVQNIDNKLQEFEKVNLSKFEEIKVELKNKDKQLEEKLYEIIRSKQKKEVKEGFVNQDKKIKEGFDNQDKKIKEGFDNQGKKIKEGFDNQDKKIKELTEEMAKIKNTRNISEEIKKLSEIVKENKLKEDERINHVTNILNEKINKVGTDFEFLDKEVKDIKKANQEFVKDIKVLKEKYNGFESNIKDISTVAISVDENCKNLLKKTESTEMNISIIEANVTSLENIIKNCNLEQMSKDISFLNVETKKINKLLPSIKKDYEKKLTDFDSKFLAKIGDIYKSINGYSQKVDTLSRKFDDKMRDLNDIEISFDDKVRRVNNLCRLLKRQKDKNNNRDYDNNSSNNNNKEINYNSDDAHDDDISLINEDLKNFKSAQQKFWTDMNNKIQVLVKQVNDKHKFISDEIDELKKNKSENSSSQGESESLKSQIHYAEDEIRKLKELVVTSISVPFKKNDSNYMILQNYLIEILQKNWKIFEKTWKQEFYKCVEEINKVLNNNKLMTLSPIVIHIPD